MIVIQEIISTVVAYVCITSVVIFTYGVITLTLALIDKVKRRH